MKRKITCPEKATLVELEYVESPETGRILGVVSCSAFKPCNSVDCDEECIHRMNRRRMAEEATGE
jgi:hypothetical protein